MCQILNKHKISATTHYKPYSFILAGGLTLSTTVQFYVLLPKDYLRNKLMVLEAVTFVMKYVNID